MAGLTFQGVSKWFGDTQVLFDVNLEISSGEFAVFVGPSGCGKSTLLRLIAGLEDISEGELRIGDKVMNAVPPPERGVAMVFQSYALYPHMNVYNNMAFSLKLSRLPSDEVDRQVREAARILQLEDLLQRLPKHLSGGQRQRVAIGRAIVRHPDVFLFDEPLSNLDAALRVQTRIEIARLHRSIGSTMIYVTHDQVEAMTLADKIVVLNVGYVEQVGTPLTLYHRPANRFVAGFIGSPTMNFLPVHVETANAAGAKVLLPGGGSVALPIRAPVGGAVLGVRPEHLRLADQDGAVMTAELELTEELGEYALLYVRGPDGGTLVAKCEGGRAPSVGDKVGLGLDPAAGHLFDLDGRAFGRVGEVAPR